MATSPKAFRFSDEVIEKLDYLCSVVGQSRTGLLSSLICSEYDKYMGNPELQKLVAQMQDMERQMKSILGQGSKEV